MNLSQREREGAELFPQSVWGVRQEALSALADRLQLASGMSQEQIEALAPSAAAEQVSAGGTDGTVAVIPLQGIITPRGGGLLSLLLGGMPGGLSGFREAFREAMSDGDVGSILLVVDSPGGLVDLVPETAAEVRAARGVKKVVAIANTEACSAAYWIASQAEELIGSPSATIGSVGVFLRHQELSRMAEAEGVTINTFRFGRFKAEANPYEKLTQEAGEHLQEMVDLVGAMFTREVAAGRGVKEEKVRSEYGEGRALLAVQAVAAGMADRVGTLEEVLAELTNSPTPTRSTAARAELEEAEPTVEEPEHEPTVEESEEAEPTVAEPEAEPAVAAGDDEERRRRVAELTFS